jgi:hypothetical protein
MDPMMLGTSKWLRSTVLAITFLYSSSCKELTVFLSTVSV